MHAADAPQHRRRSRGTSAGRSAVLAQRQRERAERSPRAPLAELHLQQRPLGLPQGTELPQIPVKSATRHPFLFRKRLGTFDPRAQPGDVVDLIRADNRQHLGYGLFNPRAEITVRQLTARAEPPDEAWWQAQCAAAVALRRDLLRLDGQTDAYRVVHAEADGLPGLVADRFGEVLVLEAFSLGMWQRGTALAELLAELCGAKHWRLCPAPQAEWQEGFLCEPMQSPHLPRRVTVQEFGTRFQVELTADHKTGFYCDQRDNRRRLAEFCSGKTVLDLCCYTGGFSVQALRLGHAAEATGVELDADAVAQARRNAQLNRVKAQFVQADVFAYMRDMLRNHRQYDVVVLDPPKLIFAREELDSGRRKYADLNRLAAQLVRPGGLLLSCSCSGLLSAAGFLETVAAALPAARRAQVLLRTGAAADHPVSTQCPETEYLKALFLRLE